MSSVDAPNPFVDVQHPIAFEHMRAEQVRPAISVLLAEAQARLAVLEAETAPATYANTLLALEDLGERLGRAMGVIGHLESVATTPELREAYNEVQPKVSAFFSSIPLSAGVYRRLHAFAASPDAARLDATRARFLKKTLESFEREGAALDDAGKARLQQLNVELSEITTRFAQNVLDSTNAFELHVEDRARLSGLPQRAIDAARESARAKAMPGYRFTLHEPSLIPVLTYLDDASLRERMYRAYNTRGASGEHDNRELVERIVALRREKAALLGFRNFVDLVVDDRMAKTSGRARSFLEDLQARSSAAFAREQQELLAFRRELEGPSAPELAPWDVAYYAEKQRARRYDFDEEALRPYFPLEQVLSGLFDLVDRLYGVRVERAPELSAWHESVRVYRIRDADGSELGVFYADLYPREQKRGGAWMNAFITGEPAPRGWTEHVGLICANVTPPVGEAPVLLSHREVQTIFHEFGHLMHHMLSRVEVKSLAGTSVAWDFVELPSQIMENFCWERASLDLIARQYQTGERIPEELFGRMRRARTYRGASAMMRQLGFGLVDLLLHTEYERARDRGVLEFGRKVLSQFTPAPLPDDYALLTSFGHLFAHPVGYAGGYYSYKWAEVLDADAFSRFLEGELFSRAVGLEFRDKILARGDSRDPMQLFVDFMGREPDLKPLLERSGIDLAVWEETGTL
jgi:oligopeptidase A